MRTGELRSACASSIINLVTPMYANRKTQISLCIFHHKFSDSYVCEQEKLRSACASSIINLVTPMYANRKTQTSLCISHHKFSDSYVCEQETQISLCIFHHKFSDYYVWEQEKLRSACASSIINLVTPMYANRKNSDQPVHLPS